jgi:hypothetical protein
MTGCKFKTGCKAKRRGTKIRDEVAKKNNIY